MNYKDILLTQDGYFCVAPAWVVNEGDYICAPNGLDDNKPREVISVVTDKDDGSYAKMLEKYIGYPLPRITAKYTKNEVKWDVSV